MLYLLDQNLIQPKITKKNTNQNLIQPKIAKRYQIGLYTVKKIQVINLASFVAQDLNMKIEILYISLPSANMTQNNQLFKLYAKRINCQFWYNMFSVVWKSFLPSTNQMN